MQIQSDGVAAPRRRDPEATSNAIVAAAAAILVEEGAAALTHRAVAARAGVALGSTTRYFDSIDDLRASALRAVADELERGLADVVAGLAGDEPLAVRLAALMDGFLSDQRQVRSSLALINAAAEDRTLREVALIWDDGLAAILSEHVSPACAAALAAYLDGLTVHTALRGGPPSRAETTKVIAAILTVSKEA